MELTPTSIAGCFLVNQFFANDERGRFVKTYNLTSFSSFGLPTDWREDFYTSSRRGVIRGMHFQTPPHDHEKLVYCIQGSILDVVLDLRKESRTYGQHFSVEMGAEHALALVVPKGLAHGFLALSEYVLVGYKLTTTHVPEHDNGIHWDSFGFNWGGARQIVSKRDRSLPAFADFVSPF